MDNKELERIYNDTYRSVYWTAMSLLKNEADAEDIVQETYVTLIDSYDTLREKDKAAAWLKRTAANKCLDRLRRTKTVNAEDEFFENVEALPEDFLPDSILESAERRRIIMDIIDNALSDDIRRTLVLFYFDEMSTKEIASLLGIPQGTVLWRLNYAKKKIKKEVEMYEKDNNDKLYAMGAPFLTKLFVKEAEQVPIKPIAASLIKHAASATARTASSQASSKAVTTTAKAASATSKTAAASASVAGKTVAGIALYKLIIAVVLLVLVIAAAVTVIPRIISGTEQTAVETVDEEVPETSDEKTDEAAGSGVTETDTAIEETETMDSSAGSVTETPADSSSSYLGTWVASDGNSTIYMTFNEDGTMDMWEVNAVGQELSRVQQTYTVEGNIMRVYFPNGNGGDPVIFSVDGDSMALESADDPSDAYVLTRAVDESFTYTAADLAGTWMSNSSGAHIYMTFNEDGTVEAWAVDANGVEMDRMTDTYTIEGNQLTLTYPNGRAPETYDIRIDGDTLMMALPSSPDAVFGYTRQG